MDTEKKKIKKNVSYRESKSMTPSCQAVINCKVAERCVFPGTNFTLIKIIMSFPPPEERSRWG